MPVVKSSTFTRLSRQVFSGSLPASICLIAYHMQRRRRITPLSELARFSLNRFEIWP